MSDKAVRKIEVKAAKKVRKFSMPIYMNVILLALGIALLIWADKVTSLISIIIGATFVVLAAYNLIAYLRVENRDMKEVPKLITAIALGIAGAFLIIQNGFIKEVISIIVGVLHRGVPRWQGCRQGRSWVPRGDRQGESRRQLWCRR